MRLLTMKPLRVSGLSGARRWGYRTAGLVTAVLMAGSLATAMAASPALAQAPNPAPGVTMGAAAPRASSVFLAYAGTDGAVYLRNEVNGSVTGLGGRLIGGPAVAQTAAGLAVFGRGTDNALWWSHQTTSGSWSSWQSLGGVITSQPGAAAGVTAGFGPLVTLARGTDGALWYRVQGTGGSWSAWRSAGGGLLAGTGPAAVNADGGLAVAVTGTDHHVWLFGPMGMQVSGFLDFGGRTNSTPGITNLPGIDVPPARGVRARHGQRAVVRAVHPADRQRRRLDVTGRQAGLGASGSHRAGRKDVRLRTRHWQPALDEERHLAVPRRLDERIRAAAANGPGRSAPSRPAVGVGDHRLAGWGRPAPSPIRAAGMQIAVAEGDRHVISPAFFISQDAHSRSVRGRRCLRGWRHAGRHSDGPGCGRREPGATIGGDAGHRSGGHRLRLLPRPGQRRVPADGA